MRLWQAGNIASLEDADTTFDVSINLFIGSFAFAADGSALVLPAEDGNHPDAAVLVAKYCYSKGSFFCSHIFALKSI